MGTLIAWVLVRDKFPGKRVIEFVIDIPFALPTIVAGLVLLTVYGTNSPVGINLLGTQRGGRVRAAVRHAAVRRAHGAAGAAGARHRGRTGGARASAPAPLDDLPPHRAARCCCRRSRPGAALAFARAMGEYGSVLLISGGRDRTTVASM